jgi:DNA-directed RNA polymerase specialized sigma24 family protein
LDTRQSWTGEFNLDWSQTVWDLVEAAGKENPAREAAVAELTRSYWGPVYRELRRQGFAADVAKDLTQDFFRRVVLEKDLFGKADPSRGRFRTFLRACLRNFVRNARRTWSRRPADRPGGPQLMGDDVLRGRDDGPSAPDTFDVDWAEGLIDRAIERTGQACRGDGLAVHWDAFTRCVLDPLLCGRSAPDRERLAEELGLDSSKQVSNALETAKRRFRKVLLSLVRSEVDCDERVDAEVLILLDALSSGSRGPGRRR